MVANEWFTSNQERQLFCLPHITEDPTYPDLLDLNIAMPNCLDVVDIHVPGVVGHHAAVVALRKARCAVLYDDGVRIIYS
jgi:hypothetical protein